MIRSKKTSKDSAMVTHLHRHMNQQHFTVPMKRRVVAEPAGQFNRLSDIGVVQGSHTAGPVTLSKQDHERAMDAAFSVLQADDDIDKAIPVLGALGALAAGAGRLAMGAGRAVLGSKMGRMGLAGYTGAKVAGAGKESTDAGTAPAPQTGNPAQQGAGNSAFDKLKEQQQEQAMVEQQQQQQMSQNLRASANPASTNTTQFS